MEALHPIHHDVRSQHGIAFNVVAYSCGAVYALGQVALQGLGKCWEATWDTTFELGINAFAGLNEIAKGISFASHHMFCVAKMVWGCVSPFFGESWDYTCSGLFEIWKVLRDLPEAIFRLIEVPGSFIGGLLYALYSDTASGFYQVGLLALFVFEVIRRVRDFGTIGALVKDCIQLLESGMNQVIGIFIATWKETAIPREHLGALLKDLAHYLYRGGVEAFKLLDSVGEGLVNVCVIPYELTTDFNWDLLQYVFYGFNEFFKGIFELCEATQVAARIPLEILWDWLREFGGYLISGLWEIIKLYDATKEDLGNSLKDMVVDPLTPYALQMRQRINEFLVEIEKAVIEVQKVIFG